MLADTYGLLRILADPYRCLQTVCGHSWTLTVLTVSPPPSPQQMAAPSLHALSHNNACKSPLVTMVKLADWEKLIPSQKKLRPWVYHPQNRKNLLPPIPITMQNFHTVSQTVLEKAFQKWFYSSLFWLPRWTPWTEVHRSSWWSRARPPIKP